MPEVVFGPQYLIKLDVVAYICNATIQEAVIVSRIQGWWVVVVHTFNQD